MNPGAPPLPSVELTNPNSNNFVRVYGYVKNIYFGPKFGQSATYLPSKISAKNRSEIRRGPFYEFSNENVDSVGKKRQWFFTPDNYTQIKYGVYPKHGYAFYESIPILNLSRRESEDLAKETRSVVFCKPDFEHRDYPSPPGTVFKIVWLDRVQKYSGFKHINVTMNLFNRYIDHLNEYHMAIDELSRDHRNSNGLQIAIRSISNLYKQDFSQYVDDSNNLIKNLLRLSIDTSRTSGIYNQLGGKRRYVRQSKGTRRGKKRTHRTRKN